MRSWTGRAWPARWPRCSARSSGWPRCRRPPGRWRSRTRRIASPRRYFRSCDRSLCRTGASLHRDWRRGNERAGTRGAPARRDGHGLGPGRVVLLRAVARDRDRPGDRARRGDLLGELSEMKRVIAVGGTHGKTTTASMAALALLETGRDPAFLIGGELRAAGTNAAWGEGDWAVIEADESDRSFLKLNRDVAVVTNIELDHHATYANLGELREAFEEFAAPAAVGGLRPGGELPRGGGEGAFGIERAGG